MRFNLFVSIDGCGIIRWGARVLSFLFIDWTEPFLVVIDIFKGEFFARHPDKVNKEVEEEGICAVACSDNFSSASPYRLIHFLTDKHYFQDNVQQNANHTSSKETRNA